MTIENFTFREARTQDELEQLFRLRHLIFTNAHPTFIPDNPHGLELDAYDARAHHFGLFCETAGAAKPVGYLRITGNDCRETALWVRQLAARYQFSDAINVRPAAPLPMMKYFHSASDKINQHYHNIRLQGERLIEAGRLCVLPEFQNLRLSCFIIESAVVFGLFHKNSNSVISCKQQYLPVYTRYGFKLLDEVSKQKVAGHDSFVLMIKWSERFQMRESLLQKFEAMLDMYEQTGQFMYPAQLQERAAFQALAA